MDICDSLLLVSNHIFYELDSTNDAQEECRYPLKLLIDACFLLEKIKEQNLYQELLLRADDRDYWFELGATLKKVDKIIKLLD